MKLTKRYIFLIISFLAFIATSTAQSPASYAKGVILPDSYEGEFWKPAAAFELPKRVNDNVPDMIDFAKRFMGTRYRSGGKSPKGFDCSGFTSYVYKNFGFTLGASSRHQYKQGESVSYKDLRPGDLVFFGGRRGGKTVGHVGMVVSVDKDRNAMKFIHSANSSGITITSYPDGGYYSRRYIGARRILD